MRITEAAARLGMSPRMLRYREELGLLPPLRDRPYGRGHAHRQFTEEDLAAITAALAIERRFDITPAALAFGLRVLTDPAARAAVADLGRRTGHVPAGPGAGRALDFEKERALRALGGGRLPISNKLRSGLLRNSYYPANDEVPACCRRQAGTSNGRLAADRVNRVTTSEPV